MVRKNRSAITGKFLTASQAKKHSRTTVRGVPKWLQMVRKS